MIYKIKANPNYISSLLGPLALATAKGSNQDVFDLIDYSSKDKTRLVIDSLILPSFERLTDSTKTEVGRALGYFLYHSNVASEVITEKLLLCEIPPSLHQEFIKVLWDSLFPEESTKKIAESVSGIVNRPLVMGEFSFSRKADLALDELVEKLKKRLSEDC
ncbi:hypothetical protein J2W23_002163 [Variovorax boronicumulans]|uniref:hypothetical protein n=1 Tax=Variovorax boronicumulans TaxID=436515 RepID=UPI0027874689|nr:hypothetical protein [Variovorax boronicumulans]MDQ0013781.1 hypothetical protein [Variovorax boronicumulans]